MAKSPETAAVAEAIRVAMKRQGLSGVDLAKRLEKARGSALPYDASVWVSKRTSGTVHLVEPTRVIYGPTAELVEIASALGVPVEELVEAANHPKPEHVQEALDDSEYDLGRAGGQDLIDAAHDDSGN